MSRALSVSVYVALVLVPAAAAQQRPAALERLEAYRGAWRTGLVEWTQVTYRKDLGMLCGVTHYMTTKFADKDVLTIDRGDENGVVVRDENGGASGDDSRAPTSRLGTELGTWEKMDGEIAPLQPTMLWIGGRSVDDPRAFGATCEISSTGLHETLWRELRPDATRRYEESREGDLEVVRVLSENASTTYWIDPRRGWSPVRVRYEDSQYDAWKEARSTLKEIDGAWTPERVEIFDSRHEGGATPAEVVCIRNAAFNKPEHPKKLTLADIGVDVGTDVTVFELNKPRRDGKWDGEQVLDMMEFSRRRLEEGPLFLREIKIFKQRRAEKALADLNEMAVTDPDPDAMRQSIAKRPSQCESLWEAYTRKFIEKYKLNEDQTQKALAVLKECQERGRAHLDVHRDEFAKYDELLKKLGQTAAAPAGKKEPTAPANGAKEPTAASNDAKEPASAPGKNENPELQAMRDKLIKPLDDIFEQRLVPRLDKIPTRAQRKDAEFGEPKKPETPSKP
jgi:hypothetical protein